MSRRASTFASVAPIIDSYARRIGRKLERFITDLVAKETKGARRRAGAGAGKRRGGRRARILCYVTGCKNIAAPRFGMFCTALHKNLPAAEKAKYRALRLKQAAAGRGAGKGKRGRRGRRR